MYIDVIMSNGATGNVISYNYVTGPTMSHGFFFHGKYPLENLLEGNHTNSTVTFDNWWGMQGPRNTVFRNRLVDGGHIRNSADGSSFIADYFNITGVVIIQSCIFFSK